MPVSASSPSVSQPEIQEVFRLPTSFAQQRLWLLNQLEPTSPVYNVSTTLRLQGTLNVAALAQSLNAIAQRHEIWRTVFEAIEGEPMQIVLPEAQIPLAQVDLRAVPPVQRAAQIQRLVEQATQTPFNLTQPPLVRALLLPVKDDDFVFSLTLHHIITDAWSLGVLIREVSLLYRAFATGQSSPLPPLPIQYADYAIWQRQWLQGDRMMQQLAYWQQRLANAPTVLNLPTDRPRPPVQTVRGGLRSLRLSPPLTQALKALSQEANATLFMTLLAGFKALLYRYTGQTDLLIGSPVLNRNRAELEGLIGCFLSTLVMRTDVAGNPSFRELLLRVRDTAIAAYVHQDLPFEKLVDSLPLERNLSHPPLFQVMFTLQSAPVGELSLPGLTLSPVQSSNTTAKFDLTLMFEEDEAELKGRLEYNADLFEPETIQRLAAHLQVLLAAIVQQPDQRLSELPLLTPAEHPQRQQWNQTDTAVPQQGLHTLIAAQVERTPETIALRFEDQTLSYQQLNAQANQLAHYLQRQGIQPDTPVGICLERSPQMVVALLAVLKAGGAYLPLDPAFPQARLAWMLQDAQVPLLLTQSQLQSALPACPGTQVLCLDQLETTLATEPTTNPVSLATPQNLAYIIYTSGSTGKPKGVQIPHAALVNVLTSMEQQPGLTAEDRLLSVTTLSFDIAALELFLPLLVGAQLVVTSREVAADGVQLAQCLQQSGATVMQATPATWQMLLTAGWSGNPALKVLCGGEALPLSLAHQLSGRCASLWNLYGPTEATIWSAVAQVEPDCEAVPIGRPIANTQFYVLDAHQQVVPVGVPGELHIGGQGLARGYLNRADLTAERFIPHPFAQQPGERLYKTGDLVRYRLDGTLAFLGRLDHQVKLRGFRIELGEIEAALQSYEWIQQAVVQMVQERLVAYVVPVALSRAEEAPSLAAPLQSYLQERLPEYMVPATFVPLAAFPLTPNGKINRQALPEPELSATERSPSFTAPRTPLEDQLCAIWSNVLARERIGISDNFFESGGHSLLATQMIARVRNELGVELPLRAVFEAPTVAELALRVGPKAAPPVTLPPITPIERSQRIPLSWAQQRLWFLDQLQSGNAAYNIPVAVRLEGTLDRAALERSLNEIVRRHEALRTTFKRVGEQAIQAIAPQCSFALPLVDLQQLPPDEQQAVLQHYREAEAQSPFDLQQGPLVRGKLLCLAATEHVALLTLHHIVSDRWSMGVLVRELAALYMAHASGLPSPLPELPIQYADFAMWQRQQLQGEVLAQQLRYWQRQLADAPELLSLPLDRPRPPRPSAQAARHWLELPQTLTESLSQFSRHAGATLFMTLLAAFNVLLSVDAGQADILVGSPIANRRQAETE